MKSLRFGLTPLNKEISTSVRLKSKFGLKPKITPIISSALRTINDNLGFLLEGIQLTNNNLEFLLTGVEEASILASTYYHGKRGALGSFQTLLHANGNFSNYQEDVRIATSTVYLGVNRYQYIARTAYRFDTSFLGGDKTIVSAKLILNPVDLKLETLQPEDESALVIQSVPSNLVAGQSSNYEKMDTQAEGLVRLAADTPYSDFAVGVDKEISFNSTGRNYINQVGNTFIGVKCGIDFNDSLGFSNYLPSKTYMLRYYFQSMGATRPRLVITYY